MMTIQIRRIGIVSAAKIGALVHLGFAIFAVLPAWFFFGSGALASLIAPISEPGARYLLNAGYQACILTAVTIIVGSLISGALGWGLAALAYNISVNILDSGIELEIEETTEPSPARILKQRL